MVGRTLPWSALTASFFGLVLVGLEGRVEAVKKSAQIDRRRLTAASCVAAILFCATGAVPSTSVATTDSRLTLIERADARYERRGTNVNAERRADPAPIRSAIEIYEGLLAEDPTDMAVRWRLLRALYFAGDHSSEPEERRRETLERAREVGGFGMDQLAVELGGGTRLEEFDTEALRARVPVERREEVAAIYYWTAVAWGSWSQLTGTLRAIGDGVGNRLFEFSHVVVSLDPGHQLGGAHRLRSYLHATLPSIPFVTGWVDRDLAVPEAEAALAFDDADRGNRVIYGVALVETREDRRQEAVKVLREVAMLEPRDEHRTEDLSIRALALEKLGDDAPSL